MGEHSAESEARCVPKAGWLSGETYCAIHGRAAGWPCVTTSVIPPAKPAPDLAQRPADQTTETAP